MHALRLMGGRGFHEGRERAPELSDFLRRFHEQIVVDWQAAVHSLELARDAVKATLIDRLPVLLQRIAQIAGEEAPERYDLQRLGDGLDPSDVVRVLSMLRDSVVRTWEKEKLAPHVHDGLRSFHQLLDKVIGASIEHQVRARDRILETLDRICTAGPRVRSVDELLQHFLTSFVDSTPETDVGAVLLFEGEQLRVCAAVGLDDEARRARAVADGEHLARRAGEARRKFLRHPGPSGLRALYGVPLEIEGRLIGIAQIGSTTADELSNDTLRLFSSLAARASNSVHRQLLRELAEERESARAEAANTLSMLDQLLSASSAGIGFIDTEYRIIRVNDALAALTGRPPEALLGRSLREINPADAAFFEPLMREVIETGKSIVDLEFDRAPPSTPNQVRSFIANYFPVRSAEGRMLGVGAVVVEITARKQAADRLRRWERIMSATGAGVVTVVPDTSEVVEANPAFARMHGYESPAEVIGRPLANFFAEDSRDQLSVHEAIARERGEHQYESVHLRKDGSTFHSLTSLAVIRDGTDRIVYYVGSFLDITERKRSELEQTFMTKASAMLAESLDYETTLSTIAKMAVPSIADYCIVDLLNDDGSIQRLAIAHRDEEKVEKATEINRSYPPLRSIEDAPRRVVRTGKPELVPEIDDRLLQRLARDAEHLRLLRSLGLTSYVTVPMVSHQVLGAITLVWAESRRRYDQRDLELAMELARRAALAIENARLYRDAQRETRLREEVLAIVSHDLRNPLSSISLTASALLRAPDRSAPKQIETIKRNADRMTRLIGDLLDMARIRAGRLAIDGTWVDPAALVREVLELQAPFAREKSIQIDAQLEIDECKLFCDRERILQVFSNLIGNAIKFCREGDKVTIRAHAADQHLEFAVADTGPGIPKSELSHIFEAYWSADRHAKHGTGLGLYISKGIVEAHGGRVWVESELGVGTTFHFTIPEAAPDR